MATSLDLPDILSDAIDEAVEDGEFTSRSEAMRHAVRETFTERVEKLKEQNQK